MRRTLAAACTVAAVSAGMVLASAAPATAQPVFCVIATVEEPVLGNEFSTNPFCIQSQPWGVWCDKQHVTLLGNNPNDPYDPTAFHVYTHWCVVSP